MKHNLSIVLGCVLLVALITATAVLMLQIDRTAPTIIFEYDIHYDDSESISTLLDGVKAFDEKDGDVSNEILVESLIVLEDMETAKVTYAVKDRHNNVSKAYRIVSYSGSGNSIFTSSTELLEESMENSVELVESVQASEAASEVASQSESQIESQLEAETTAEGETEETTEEVTTEDVTTKAPTTEAPTTEAPTRRNTDSTKPVITLKAQEGSVAIGGNFNVAAYVASIKDDKDTREELYRRIGIEGSYNTNVPGDYVFYIYCIDTDRNASNKERFVLHVGGFGGGGSDD